MIVATIATIAALALMGCFFIVFLLTHEGN